MNGMSKGEEADEDGKVAVEQPINRTVSEAEGDQSLVEGAGTGCRR